MIKNLNTNIISLVQDSIVTEIHRISLRILEEIGIPIASEKALNLLHDIGCKTDKRKKVIFIPEDVVMESLKKVNTEYDLYNRTGLKNITLGGDNISFMSGAAAIRVRDLNGIYREPTLQDLADMTRVQDHLENIDVIHGLVEPSDIEQGNYRVRMAAEMLRHTTKPCAFVVEGPEDVMDIYQMGIAIRGSEKELVEKPLFSIHDISAEATLGIVREQCNALMKCAEFSLPTGLGSYPIMGTTGPVTPEGSLALANANILCGLVIAQAVKPGAPFLYMIMAGSMNMRNAEMVTASPEIWAYYVIGKKLANYYHLPSHCIISADSKITDIQLAMEKYTAMMFAILCGINLIHGTVCESDAMNCANYEQILIDNEFVSMIKHFMNAFTTKKESNWEDNIFKDIKGSLTNKMYFLDSDTTVKSFRHRLWMSDLLIRTNFYLWKEKGMRTIIDNSIDKTKQILNTYEVEPLDTCINHEIENILTQSQKRV